MNRRREVAETISANVAAQIAASNSDVVALSKAADLPTTDMKSRLDARSNFTVGELVKVSGFFRVPISELTKGVTL